MDSIRKAQRRPTVALVLSGGGAKGSAHVGAKKFIDEIGIPVDVICGTSMGGLMGGLMAMGYSCDYIDSLLRSQDWGLVLSDKVDPKYIPYDTKLYKSTYQLSVPFHYENDTFENRVLEQEKFQSGNGRLKLDSQGDEANTQKGVNNLASSLPSGYVYGFNVNNLLSSFTVGYQDSISFRDLPIPFFCVASDMISCKAKNWGTGSVKSAMRSTMSIPGLFDPVRTQGMVLVDGGTRNNFPVDLARAMGADYVIGVELSDMNPSYSQVNNIGNILSQFITMLGKDAYDKNVYNCDVFIKPDLQGYNMLSFSPEAIDTMIHRGYVAAAARKDGLLAIKEMVGDSTPYLNGRPAVDISRTPVQLGSIIFDGINDNESRILQRKTGLIAGQYASAIDINTAMSRIQATGCFESVTYTLLGKEEPYQLVFNCVKAPTHQVGVGLRADNTEWVSLLFNLGLNTHKLMGSKFDFSLKFGPCQSLNMRYSLDLPYLPTINVDAKVAYNRTYIMDPDFGDFYWTFWSHRERIYFSNMSWTRLNMKLGVANKFFQMPDEWNFSSEGINLPDEMKKGNYTSAFLDAGLYTMDNMYYPSKGTNFSAGYELVFSKSGMRDFHPYNIIFANWKIVIPIGAKWALIPDLHWRSVMNMNPVDDNYLAAYSLGLSNYTGGTMAGRYVDQLMPFVGSNYMYWALDHLAVLNATLRYNPVKNLFIEAEGGIVKDASLFSEMFTSFKPKFFGAAAGVGYNTIIGPLKAKIMWSDLSGMGYSISLGFDF